MRRRWGASCARRLVRHRASSVRASTRFLI